MIIPGASSHMKDKRPRWTTSIFCVHLYEKSEKNHWLNSDLGSRQRQLSSKPASDYPPITFTVGHYIICPMPLYSGYTFFEIFSWKLSMDTAKKKITTIEADLISSRRSHKYSLTLAKWPDAPGDTLVCECTLRTTIGTITKRTRFASPEF